MKVKIKEHCILCWPLLTSSIAVSFPIPVFAPVTITTLPSILPWPLYIAPLLNCLKCSKNQQYFTYLCKLILTVTVTVTDAFVLCPYDKINGTSHIPTQWSMFLVDNKMSLLIAIVSDLLEACFMLVVQQQRKLCHRLINLSFSAQNEIGQEEHLQNAWLLTVYSGNYTDLFYDQLLII